jgi:acyl-CoA synthetase (AMP-forming)/AMP-acid ligase II
LRSLTDVLLERQQLQPAQIAYTYLLDGETQEQAITYGELAAKARAIGVQLQERFPPGSHVLLLYPPGLDFITGFFGCLCAGAVAVPVYPPDPSRLERSLSRLRAIVDDAAPMAALTTSPLLQMAGPLITGDPRFSKIAWIASDLVDPALGETLAIPSAPPGSIAFLQYTSGTTSTPKGVMLTHANLLANFEAIYRCFGNSKESSGFIWLPSYHDMGLIGGILAPLWGGNPMTLMSPLDFLQRPVRWLQAISRVRATVSGGPNFAYDLCVKKVTPEERAALDLSCWQLAFTGAEPVRAGTLDAFADCFAPAGFQRRAFYPCYGLAEATLLVSGGAPFTAPRVLSLNPDALARHEVIDQPGTAPGARQLVSCGRSTPGHTTLVVNPATLTPLPDGQVGEIWVSGPSIATGYWQKPEENERTFQARASDGRGPFLRTGDLGFLCDGELYVTGRLKDVVIVRGRNFYPQDIELSIEASHPAVRPGCTAVFALEGGATERAAAVVEVRRDFARGADAAARWAELVAAIRTAVARDNDLALEVVAFVPPGSVPKTSSGKIQRSACREALLGGTLEVLSQSTGASPGEAGTTVTREHLVQRPAAERLTLLLPALCAELAARLGVRESEIDADLSPVALGLDSLRGVELAGWIEERFELSLSGFGALWDQSVRQLAAELAGRLDEAPVRRAPRGPTAGELPPSSAQQRLWLLHQLDPSSAAYHVPAAVSIEGPLDPEALQRSLLLVIERQASLRTVLREDAAARLVQEVRPAEVTLPCVDLAALPESEREAGLRERELALGRQPFDLAEGPLFRAELVRLGAERHVLLLVAHHAVADGWSMALVVRELGALYPAIAAGKPSPLPPLRTTYADFALEDAERTPSEETLAFWRTYLDGAPPITELPTDRPRPAASSTEGGRVSLRLASDTVEAVRGWGRRRGATPFITLLTSLGIALHRWTGQRDFVLGTVVVDRTRQELQSIVGDFTNYLPLRCQFVPEASASAVLDATRASVRATSAHAGCPFQRIVKAIAPERGLSHNQLYNVGFVLHDYAVPRDLQVGSDLRMSLRMVDNASVELDLLFEAAFTPEGLSLDCKYRIDLFEERTIAQLIERIAAVLRQLAADPERPIGSLDLFVDGERQRIVEEWNRTARPFPSERTLHGLIEEQARRPREPPGAVPARAGGRAHEPCRDLHGALDRAPGRAPRRAQSGRGLRAARSGIPGSAPRVDGAGLRARRGPDPWRLHPGGARVGRRAGHQARRGVGAGGGPSPRSDRLGHERRRAGVRHLHLRLDGGAEGRDERAPGGGQPAPVDGGRVRLRARGRRPAEDDDQLRRVGLGAVPAAPRRGAVGARPPGRPQGQRLSRRADAGARGDDRALRPVDAQGHARREGCLRPLRRALARLLQRRGVAARSGREAPRPVLERVA